MPDRPDPLRLPTRDSLRGAPVVGCSAPSDGCQPPAEIVELALSGVEFTGIALPAPELVDLNGEGLDAPNDPDELPSRPAQRNQVRKQGSGRRDPPFGLAKAADRAAGGSSWPGRGVGGGSRPARSQPAAVAASGTPTTARTRY